MIPRHEFKSRRKRLMRAMGKHSVAIVASSPPRIRNRDVEYPFRQDSDFYYLTGFNESDAIAVLSPERKGRRFILFCREYDEKLAVWVGKNAGLDGAREVYGADEARPIAEFQDALPELIGDHKRVYFAIGQDSDLDRQVFTALSEVRGKARSGVGVPYEFVSLDHLLHDLRLIKSPAEIRAMRHAADVSSAAHRRVMRACRPGRYEYEIEAELVHEFTRHGLRAQAYPCIVAGGANACVLHYTDNREMLRDGELLLVDAGAECDHYAADITRTFPVNGRFSEPQKALYELVLEAQHAAIAAVKPGKRWNEPHEAAVRVLTRGLVELGLLTGQVKTLIKEGAYKQFFMHRTGHWLGMDVHDVGDYRVDDDWRTLEPGMVLTVEPGLYIPADCLDVDARWRGIGIRIEDDVLVTQHGHEILTSGVPKTVTEIEEFMQS